MELKQADLFPLDILVDGSIFCIQKYSLFSPPVVPKTDYISIALFFL